MTIILIILSYLLIFSISSSCHWGYEHPSEWGTICDQEYILCSEGQSQSPINIINQEYQSTKKHFNAEIFDVDGLLNGVLENNGHTVKFSLNNGGKKEYYLKIENIKEKYKFIQFHHHYNSETTFDGERRTLELHFVHVSEQSGKIAVVAIYFMETENVNNEFIRNFVIPTEINEIKEVSLKIKNILKGNEIFYHYMGSLTTPPCTEDVNWFVYPKTFTASKELLDSFDLYTTENTTDGNTRPTNPLNGRTIQTIKYLSSEKEKDNTLFIIFFVSISIIILALVSFGFVVLLLNYYLYTKKKSKIVEIDYIPPDKKPNNKVSNDELKLPMLGNEDEDDELFNSSNPLIN